MKPIKIKTIENYTNVLFDNDVEIRISMFTSWATEHTSICLLLKEEAYELVINDPCSSNENRVMKFKRDGTILSQIETSITNPWKIIEIFGLTKYLKAVIALYRKQHKDEYLPKRSNWIGDESRITYFILFPKESLKLKIQHEVEKMLTNASKEIAEIISEKVMKGELCDDAFKHMEEHLNAACEEAYNIMEDDEE